ncbi:MAG: hypothetical protein U0Q18_34295 [Bryobacteraceae bacterium]
MPVIRRVTMPVNMRWPGLLLLLPILSCTVCGQTSPADWTIYVTNDACSDYTWGFHEEATRRAYAEVVRAHLDEMTRTDSLASENQDRYNLSISQEGLMFRRYYPERWPEFLRRVREGRIYIGPFLNNNLWAFQGSESLIRSMYAARSLAEEAGVPMKVGVHIEEPGLPWGAASILASSGIQSLLVHFLDYDSKFSQLTNPPFFAWEGPDGGSIRVLMDDWASEKYNYVQGGALLKKPELVEAEWLPHYSRPQTAYPARAILAAGTHGDNNPTNGNFAGDFAGSIARYNSRPGAHARLVNATLPQFFAALDEQTGTAYRPPLLRGDFGHAWDAWPVALAKYAGAARMGERAFLAAESLVAAASRQDPALIDHSRIARREAEWNWVMLADHAWNGADDANRIENARLRREWSTQLNRLSADLERQAWKALALSPDPGSVVLFNSLWMPRTDLVAVDAPDGIDTVFDGANALPTQTFSDDGRRRLHFMTPVVPRLGFASVRLGHTAKKPAESDLTAAPWQLESPAYRLKIDPHTGAIGSLYDKSLQRELAVRGEHTLGQTVFYDGRQHAISDIRTDVVAAGPVFARLKVTAAIDEIRLTTFFTLYAGLNRIDIDYRIQKPVTVAEQRLTHVFPVVAPGAVQRIETTGAVLRPFPAPAGDLLPGADPARLVVQGFVDTSLPQGPGVTIAPLEAFTLRPDLTAVTFEALGNDQNYKESTRNQNGETEFRFRYSLRSHAGAYDQADAVVWSRSVATPLLVTHGRLTRTPLAGVEVDPNRAAVTAWKPADGEGLILRLWETAGRAGPLRVRIHDFRKAMLTDLLERDLSALPIRAGQVSVDLRRYGFSAIRLLP